MENFFDFENLIEKVQLNIFPAKSIYSVTDTANSKLHELFGQYENIPEKSHQARRFCSGQM